MSAVRQSLPKITQHTPITDWRSVSEAIADFETINTKLRMAIEWDDDKNIMKLDGQLSQKFEEIMSMEVQEGTGLEQLTDFLLEQLAPSVSRSPVQSRICLKLKSNICRKYF